MHDAARAHFDRMLEDAIGSLPDGYRELLPEISIIAIDRPTAEMVRSLRTDGTLGPDEDGSDLCGLHTGTSLTDRSLESEGGRLPDQVHIFREGIVALAMSTEEQEGDYKEWEQAVLEGDAGDLDEYVYEEIRVTLLHEIGHHFGLDEDDLDELGYA